MRVLLRVALSSLAAFQLACDTPSKGAVLDETVTIAGEPSCAACSIVADSVAHIPHPSDTLAIVDWVMPAVDSRGRFYTIGAGDTRVHVMGPDGKLLQSIGKPGSGPGEWRPQSLGDVEVGLGDTLFVFGSQRVYVFSPSLELVREFPFRDEGGPNGVRPLADGSFVLAAPRNRFSTLTSGGVLDSVTMRGRALRDSARAEQMRLRQAVEPLPVGTLLEGADTTRCMGCGMRHLAEGAKQGTIWSASPHQYVVEQHDLQGKLLRRVVRDVAWYPRWPEETIPAGAEGMGMELAIDSNEEILKQVSKSRIFALSQDSLGILWVFSVTQDPNNPFPRDLDFLKALDADNNLLDQHFVTVIEAIDAERGVLLASTRLRGQAHPLSRGLVSHVLPDDLNGKSHRILRLSVRGYTRKP